MYRTYADPYKLEKRLQNMIDEYNNLIACGRDIEDLIDLAQDIEETKEQINFAWQDDEAEIEGYE